MKPVISQVNFIIIKVISVPTDIYNRIETYHEKQNKIDLSKICNYLSSDNIASKKKVDYNIIDNVVKIGNKKSYRKLAEDYNSKIIDKNLKISATFMYKILKTCLYKKVKTQIYNPFRDLKLFFHYKYLYNRKLVEILKSNYEIIYIDESHFTNSSDKNDYMWVDSTKVTDENIKYQSEKLTTSLTLATSFKKIYYYEFNFRNNATTFLEFLKSLIQILLNEKDLPINKYFLYLDNATIHKAKIIRDYLKKKKQNVIYAVKYYPDYDMCEYIFSMLKKEQLKCSFTDMYII